MNPKAALKALEDDYGYYHTPCRDLPLVSIDPPLTYAAKAWLGMTVNHGVKNQMDGERDKAIADFEDDVHGVGWTAYTLDRAIVAWRRLGKEFMPTQGQLNLAMKEAKQTPGTKVYSEFLSDLRKAAGQAQPKPPKDLPNASRDEKRKLFEKLKADKARGYAVRSDGRQRPWLPIDEQTLATLSRFFEGASA